MKTRTLVIATLVAAFSLGLGGCVKSNKGKDAKADAATVEPKKDDTKADKGAATNGKTAKADPNKQPSSTPADAAKAPPKTGPVAKVNGVVIKREALNKELGELEKRFAMFGGKMPPQQLKRFETKIVERLVEDELIKQKLDAEKVEVTDAEVTKELEEQKKRMPGGEAQFEAFLKRSGMSIDRLKEDLKKKIALRKFLNKDKALDVTDAEAKKHYEDNKERFASKERVKASHILIKTADAKAGPKGGKGLTDAQGGPKGGRGLTDAQAKKKAQEVYKLASKKGADFAALAKEHSMGPSAPRGGDLGFFEKGRMVKEFQEAAFKLKKGQVSKPVKTRFGYHIIKVAEKEEAGQKPFDEVKEQIVARLEARKFRDAKDKLVAELKTRGKVEVMN